MEKADLTKMLVSNQAFRRMDVERECGCYPNQVWRFNSWFVLLVLNSLNGPDWPIGQRGLVRARASLDAERVTNSYVLLAKRNGDGGGGLSLPVGEPQYANHETLGNVERFLARVEPTQYRSDFGPCWFVDQNFNLVMHNKMKRDTYQL